MNESLKELDIIEFSQQKDIENENNYKDYIRHQEWLEWKKTHHDIQDSELQKYLNDPDVMIELCAGIRIAKIINSDLELRNLLVRFGNWDHNSKFENISIVQDFKGVLEVKCDESECYPESVKNHPGELLSPKGESFLDLH